MCKRYENIATTFLHIILQEYYSHSSEKSHKFCKIDCKMATLVQSEHTGECHCSQCFLFLCVCLLVCVPPVSDRLDRVGSIVVLSLSFYCFVCVCAGVSQSCASAFLSVSDCALCVSLHLDQYISVPLVHFSQEVILPLSLQTLLSCAIL